MTSDPAAKDGRGHTTKSAGRILHDAERLAAYPALEADRARLRERVEELAGLLELAETLRPAMLKDFGYVPEYVLNFCNRARALSKSPK